MHLIDLSCGFMGATPIVSSSIPVATGAAFALAIRNQNAVAVVFLGDGSIEEGVFHESINFATLKNLPVLFFCENNLYSVYSPMHVRQPDRKIIDLVRGHGLSCYEADGNNVLDVYEVVQTAVKKIKDGKGPIFIE